MANDKLDNRNRLLQQMGLIYSQIMNLNEQMTEALQNAVDIDISVTGGVSDITKDFMEGFHYKIDENARVVSEQKKWEYDRLPPVRETEPVQIEQNTDVHRRTITQEKLNKLVYEHREKQRAGNYETLDLSNCIFNNIEFTGKLSGINLMGSELNECTFQNVEMENSYLSNAEFMNTMFSDCTFHNTLFRGAEMGYCEIKNTIYTDCIFHKAAMVACGMEASGMNACYMSEAMVSDTKFTNVVANNCGGTGSIDFSGIDKDLRKDAESIFNAPERIFDFEIRPDSQVAVYAHMGEEAAEKIFHVDYNPDTHRIEKISGIDSLHPERAPLFNRAADMLRIDIQKGFQKQQFDNRKISQVSPCVMVEMSEIKGLNDNTLYDMKEFSDKLESYGRDESINKIKTNPYDKIRFTIAFDSGDGGGVRTWEDKYYLRDDKDTLIERLENSRFFNNAELTYLKNYIAGEKSPVIDMPTAQHPKQEPKPSAETLREKTTQNETPQKENLQKEKRPTSGPAKYAALVYVKGSNVKTRVTGTSPEKIIELCQKWNTERASDNQLGTAYIKKYNPEAKAYENFGKYDISKGVALQPIYLELPSLGKEKFGQMISELKTNGAKYNPELKKWYVTQACDLSLFKEYLPKQPEPQIDAKGERGGKKSVIDNLSQNKSNLDKNAHKGNQPQEQQRKQDAPER